MHLMGGQIHVHIVIHLRVGYPCFIRELGTEFPGNGSGEYQVCVTPV